MGRITLLSLFVSVWPLPTQAQGAISPACDTALTHAVFKVALKEALAELEEPGRITLNQRAHRSNDTLSLTTPCSIPETWPVLWLSDNSRITFETGSAKPPQVFLSYPQFNSPVECRVGYSLTPNDKGRYSGWYVLKKLGRHWRVRERHITSIACGSW